MNEIEEVETGQAKQVANEQTKLTANFLNGIGLACLVVGVFGVGYALLSGHPRDSGAIFVFAAVAAGLGYGFHEIARRVLAGLR